MKSPKQLHGLLLVVNGSAGMLKIMGYKNHRSNKDAGHAKIELSLRRAGHSVWDASAMGKSFPDIICASRDAVVLIEVKTEDGKFYIDQLETLATWRNYCAFVTNTEDALKVMESPKIYCLSNKDKNNILKIVDRYRAKTKSDKPEIWVKVFEQEMEKLNGK